MNDTGSTISAGLTTAWTLFMAFLPKLFLFAVILVVGYFVARLAEKVLDAILERVGFDRLVERGGVKRALEKSNLDASSFVSKLAKYAIILFTLQLAFGVFGPNPINDLLTRLISYLPNVFYAVIILIVGSAIATGVKRILETTMANVSFGRVLASGASAAVLVVAVFAALNELNIAPAIINGLFYAALFVIAGSLVISIGVGGIGPMRGVWERALGKVQAEVPKIAQAAASSTPSVPAGSTIVAQPVQPKTTGPVMTTPQPPPHEEEPHHENVPRFKP
ncbi:MAG: helix repeat-containing protein [Verrucomicrobiales bacterium]|jgi:hypothetical protein|nr:helix repeat-containing protein [Verrucomicrobiales bacterium]